MWPSLFLLMVASPALALPGHSSAAAAFSEEPAQNGPSWARAQPRLAAVPTPWSAAPVPSPLLGIAQSSVLSGFAGKPIPLLLLEEEGAAREARFVMIRGIPEGFLLSVGFRVKRSWFVSVEDAKSLVMTSTADFAGNVDLEIFYFRDSRDSPLASLMRTVEIRPESVKSEEAGKSVPPPAKTQTLIPPETPSPTVPVTSRKIQLSAEMEIEMLTRGGELMKHGDVAGARLLFEDLASMGSAKGAFAMAQSYDPSALRKLFIQGGLQPDTALAKMWYENAARLGSSEAERLLGARNSGAR